MCNSWLRLWTRYVSFILKKIAVNRLIISRNLFRICIIFTTIESSIIYYKTIMLIHEMACSYRIHNRAHLHTHFFPRHLNGKCKFTKARLFSKLDRFQFLISNSVLFEISNACLAFARFLRADKRFPTTPTSGIGVKAVVAEPVHLGGGHGRASCAWTWTSRPNWPRFAAAKRRRSFFRIYVLPLGWR